MKYPLLRARRWYLGHREHVEPMRSMLLSRLPNHSATLPETEFVALDLETTGLDPSIAHMLSAGWVIVRGGRVALDTARSHLVRPSKGVGSSASVHGLTDTLVGGGRAWSNVLDQIVELLSGRILLVHHAGLDKALLDRLCQRRYGVKLYVPVVDTMELELRSHRSQHHVESKSSMRLADLRDRYGLPRYAAHDCLVDAIATAELLIAMVAHRRSRTLGDLLA